MINQGSPNAGTVLCSYTVRPVCPCPGLTFCCFQSNSSPLNGFWLPDSPYLVSREKQEQWCEIRQKRKQVRKTLMCSVLFLRKSFVLNPIKSPSKAVIKSFLIFYTCIFFVFLQSLIFNRSVFCVWFSWCLHPDKAWFLWSETSRSYEQFHVKILHLYESFKHYYMEQLDCESSCLGWISGVGMRNCSTKEFQTSSLVPRCISAIWWVSSVIAGFDGLL